MTIRFPLKFYQEICGFTRGEKGKKAVSARKKTILYDKRINDARAIFARPFGMEECLFNPVPRHGIVCRPTHLKQRLLCHRFDARAHLQPQEDTALCSQ